MSEHGVPRGLSDLTFPPTNLNEQNKEPNSDPKLSV